MRRVGLEKVIANVSEGGGRVGVFGAGRRFCGGEGFFLRGIRRGNLLSWSRLNRLGDLLCGVGDACEIAEDIVSGRVLSLRR